MIDYVCSIKSSAFASATCAAIIAPFGALTSAGSLPLYDTRVMITPFGDTRVMMDNDTQVHGASTDSYLYFYIYIFT